jgi:hypothetical protein
MIVLHNNTKLRVSYVSTDRKFLLVSYATDKNKSLFKINVDDLDLKQDKERVLEKSNIYIPEEFFITKEEEDE